MCCKMYDFHKLAMENNSFYKWFLRSRFLTGQAWELRVDPAFKPVDDMLMNK